MERASKSSNVSQENKILIGWASKSITPTRPVVLSGHFNARVTQNVNDPIMATALAIETNNEQAIMVSCDLLIIEKSIQDKLREMLKSKLPEFAPMKLFLNATHTHTAPNTLENWYPPQDKEVMTPAEYVDFLINCVSDAVVEAWENRKPGGVSWAFGHAVVGHNRRAAYFDGSAQMYGSTNREDFDCIEGYEDHGVDMLFFWDPEQKPTGVVINLACPSQVTEGALYISADFWHEVRVELKKRYSNDLFILPQCGAAGDQSPHFLLHGRAEENMRKRKGVSEREEIALRIANAVDYVIPFAKSDIRTDVPFKHIVQEINLPVRKVTEKELERAKLEYERLMQKQPFDKNSGDFLVMRRAESIIDRYEFTDARSGLSERQETFRQIEFHVIRLGDIAIATNPFEMFLDFGLRIKARSKALQTFIVQLACTCTWGEYLPTAKAVAGGGYGAEVVSNLVGPEGGQMLVEQTVKLINEWH
ncbi:hypothetical protein FJZ31_01100 [Candidatus Poribacteria bacterium]|nr:hypothetical protein [Candidatus Poribacteria bacterium]